MEYVYGAMLLHAAGKDITEDSIKNVLKAAGIDADESKLKALTASLEGVNIEDVLSKAVTMPVAAAAAPAAQPETKEAAKEEKKEEEKEAVSEEEVAEGLGALFG